MPTTPPTSDRDQQPGDAQVPWQRTLVLRTEDALEAVFGPDPGLLRLELALRTVISASVVLTLLLQLFGSGGRDNIAAIALGFMLSIFANTAVRDPSISQRAITLALLTLPALTCTALSVFLAPWHLISEGCFVVLVTTATLLPALGSRGMAMGMVAFISYFIGEVTRPDLASLPIVAVSVIVSLAVSALGHALMHAGQPQRALGRIKRYMYRRVNRVLLDVDGVLCTLIDASTPVLEQVQTSNLHREVVRMNDALLTARDQVDTFDLSDASAQPLWTPFMALGLAAERLMRMARRAQPQSEVVAGRHRIAALNTAIANDTICSIITNDRTPRTLEAALDALQNALAELAATNPVKPDHTSRQISSNRSFGSRGEESLPKDPGIVALGPDMRRAIQSAIAATLAIAFGSLISGQRWYWALITTFIVGIGVGSRGEALIKALQRSLGTITGILIGLLLGSAVHGHSNLTLALILTCVFLAFYAFQVAYSVMIFCITVMVALLYGLLGQLAPELLLLRFEETALGAVIGIAVTMAVLPIRQNDVFQGAMRDFLDALCRAVETGGQPDTERREAATGDMLAKALALRNSLGAAKRGWISLTPPFHRRSVRAAMRCAYLAQEITRRGVDSADAAAINGRIAGLVTAPRAFGHPSNPPDHPLAAAMIEALNDLGETMRRA